jgi:enoyl-CoA hydratase
VGETLSIEVRDGLATVRLDRTHGNAINGSLTRELGQACRELAEDPAVRGLLLAAAGRIFCPGLDLQELVGLSRDEMERFVHGFVGTVAEMYAFPKPMVAAIHGHAIAGGCVLTLAADWRVLRRGAMIGLNEVRVGVPLPFGVAMILRESVPRTHLEEVALLGKNYCDDEALAAGLVHEVLGREEFEPRCRDRLAGFASRDLGALMITKRYLRSSILERIRQQDAARVPEFLDAWFRPETRARIEKLVDDLTRRG